MRVITAVNHGYLDLLDVWLRQSAPLLGGPPVVCCMDAGALEHCGSLPGVEALAAPDGGRSRQAFWLRRFDMLERLAAEGDIAHSDADAFWLADPWPLIDAVDADLVFSREFGVPRRVGAAWGFVLCCGFFVARAGEGTRALFRAWRKATRRRLDDQIALNELLHGAGARWRREAVPGGEASRCTVDIVGTPVSIVALPHVLITREPPFGAPDALVAHPYFERQFFRSYVALHGGLLAATGSVAGLHFEAGPAGDLLKPRDAATFHALRWFVRREPAAAVNWAHLGALQVRMGDRSGAADSFARVLEHGADDSWTLFTLGTGLAALGRRSEAVDALSRLAGRHDLEFELARKAAATLAGLGAISSAAALAASAGRAVGLAGGLTLAARYASRKPVARV
ncbi:MAG: hypothetical protein GC201_02745 [Alphaproteobacteria bacterium]|nr:hypothetical protein [Alphaproteobacteria bacterium]